VATPFGAYNGTRAYVDILLGKRRLIGGIRHTLKNSILSWWQWCLEQTECTTVETEVSWLTYFLLQRRFINFQR